ncbi:MAG: META domain-containing protein [Candidatus Taylorbacteria bacterium]|nr:META domain-containing protein [Candidatus Taylorbacteria bacterium]
MNPKDIFTERNIIYAAAAVVVILLIVLMSSSSGKPASKGERPVDEAIKEVDLVSVETWGPYVPPVEIDGVTFKLASYKNSPMAEGEDYTLSFSGASLSAKFCNQMSGTFVLLDGVIRSDLASTKMFCGAPAGLMSMEASFGSMLSAGASFYVEGDVLTIRGPEGEKFAFKALSR